MKTSKLILLTLILSLFAPITFAQGQFESIPQAIVKGGRKTIPYVSTKTIIERNIATQAISPVVCSNAQTFGTSGSKFISIFHTSDAHGFFYPRGGKGGYAALASLIKKQNLSAFLLLDSGDFSNGTPETLSSQGLSAVTIMNAMHYNAATLGNHDFAFHDGDVTPLLRKARFSVLAANLFEAGTFKRPPHVKPYEIFTCDGVKFAVIGLANNHPLRSNGKYTFAPQLQELENILPEVESQNPNVVVVLAHDSVKDEHHYEGQGSYIEQIGHQFSGRVHIVLGGHAHNIFQNKKINDVLFVESGHSLQNVSKIVVEINNATGKVVNSSSELIPLVVEETGQDEAIRNVAEMLREPGIDTPLGTTAAPFEDWPLFDDQLDHPINNWIADLIRKYSEVDIGLINDSGTRVGLPAGNITERALIEAYPFDNTIMKFSISGQALLEFTTRTLGEFSFSGMDIIYTQDTNGNPTIISIQINGHPLDIDKSYTLATSSYLAQKEFPEIPVSLKENVGTQTLHSLMKEDLITNQTITPPDVNRIRRVP